LEFAMVRYWVALLSIALVAVSCSKDPQDVARDFAARGDKLAAEGRDDAALIEYRNAVREWPAWSEGYRKLGETLSRLGRTNEAYRAFANESRVVDGRLLPHDEKELRDVVATQPDAVGARLALAELLLEKGDSAEAETQLTTALAREPNNELANRSLAALYIGDGRKAEAEKRLAIAAAHTPQRYRSKLAYADFLMAERRFAAARPVLNEALADPQLADAVKLRLAVIDYEEGARAPARQALSDLLATDATAEAWTVQAEFLYREGEMDEALNAARQALALDPSLPEAQNIADTIRRGQLWK
jgi:Tfp pilus assembly protein PilF